MLSGRRGDKHLLFLIETKESRSLPSGPDDIAGGFFSSC
jgi:hypothetical protein